MALTAGGVAGLALVFWLLFHWLGIFAKTRTVLALVAAIGLGGAHLGPASLVLLIIGVLLMDACVQGSHVINQSVIYDLLPQARSRLTTVYITTMFAGGAIGSAAGAQAYAHWGWAGATLVAAARLTVSKLSRVHTPRPRPAVLAGRPPPRGHRLAHRRHPARPSAGKRAVRAAERR